MGHGMYYDVSEGRGKSGRAPAITSWNVHVLLARYVALSCRWITKDMGKSGPRGRETAPWPLSPMRSWPAGEVHAASRPKHPEIPILALNRPPPVLSDGEPSRLPAGSATATDGGNGAEGEGERAKPGLSAHGVRLLHDGWVEPNGSTRGLSWNNSVGRGTGRGRPFVALCNDLQRKRRPSPRTPVPGLQCAVPER